MGWNSIALSDPIHQRTIDKPVAAIIDIPGYSFAQLNLAIEALKEQYSKLERLPLFGDPEGQIATRRGDLSREVMNSGQRLFSLVFRADSVIELTYCDVEHAESAMDTYHKTLCVSPSLVKTLLSSDNKTTLDFVLAHEFSHYLVELYLEIFKKTPFGILASDRNLDIILESHDIDREDVRYLKVNQPDFYLSIHRTIEHAEVDAMAAALLRKLGYTNEQIRESVENLFSVLMWRSQNMDLEKMSINEFLEIRKKEEDMNIEDDPATHMAQEKYIRIRAMNQFLK